MRNISTRSLGGILLVAVTLTFAAACDQNKLKESAKAADRIEIVSTAAIDTIVAFEAQNVITKDQEKAVAQILLDVNTGNRELITTVRAAKAWDAPTKQSVTRIVAALAASVGRLNDAGLLHIQSADAKAKFAAIVAALQSALAIIEANL